MIEIDLTSKTKKRVLRLIKECDLASDVEIIFCVEELVYGLYKKNHQWQFIIFGCIENEIWDIVNGEFIFNSTFDR